MITYFIVSLIVCFVLPYAILSDIKVFSKSHKVILVLYDVICILVFSYFDYFYTGFLFVASFYTFSKLVKKSSHTIQPESDTVYVNKISKIYHASSHCGLSNYPIKISFSTASAAGYTPCRTCMNFHHMQEVNFSPIQEDLSNDITSETIISDDYSYENAIESYVDSIQTSKVHKSHFKRFKIKKPQILLSNYEKKLIIWSLAICAMIIVLIPIGGYIYDNYEMDSNLSSSSHDNDSISTSSKDSSNDVNMDKSYNDSVFVYVTRYGSKYHRSKDCGNMTTNYPIVKSQAIDEGYEPCSICY